jgi:hypothetical protein
VVPVRLAAEMRFAMGLMFQFSLILYSCQKSKGRCMNARGSDAGAEGLECTRWCGRCMSASVRAMSTLRIAARKVWCLLRLFAKKSVQMPYSENANNLAGQSALSGRRIAQLLANTESLKA